MLSVYNVHFELAREHIESVCMSVMVESERESGVSSSLTSLSCHLATHLYLYLFLFLFLFLLYCCWLCLLANNNYIFISLSLSSNLAHSLIHSLARSLTHLLIQLHCSHTKLRLELAFQLSWIVMNYELGYMMMMRYDMPMAHSHKAYK